MSDENDRGFEQDGLEWIQDEEKDEGFQPGSGSGQAVVPASDTLPERVYLLPIHNRPFFPAQVQPLVINRERWEETIRRVGNTPHQMVGLAFVGETGVEELGHEDFPVVGTAVKVHKLQGEESQLQFIAQGMRRFRIQRWLSKKPPYLVEVSYPREPVDAEDDETRAYAMALINGIKELLPINPLYGEELKHYLNRFGPHEPGPLTDFAAAITSAKGPELQDVLATLPVTERMQKVLPLLRKEIDVAQLQSEISEQVNAQMQERQREFFLREQLKVIQRELGISKDDRENDVDTFRARLTDKVVPERVMERIDDELDKLSVLETGSPEYGTTRHYLDWLTSLPWGITSDDQLDLAHARQVLDRDHDGLKDVKERIVEFLAEGTFKGDVGGSILLLVGPPGVGKTSVGRSIAEALGREFYRFSVGGMRDEAEIKGHRRTYVGAMPGKLVQAIKEVEVENPVIMLDEIDKMGQSFQGDPASALLEVLDPEQNVDFLDHYLDVRLDLSKVLFVCTANTLDSIPPALLDRMEQIRLSGYIAEEKMAIAKHHLWPKLLKRDHIPKKRINLTDAALRQIIEGYAREAGVRQLEKQLHRIVRKAAVKLLENGQQTIKVSVKNLEEFLGAPTFRKEKVMKGEGVVTGLAWTAMGGATLSVEAGKVHALDRGFKLTGQLGEVMKESANIAYSYVLGHLGDYGAEPDFFDSAFVHLHVPEGATPKDGPSAGVTMTTALLSLARHEPIDRPLAMTGELTLTGQVLPVGGIREKVIAARRSEIFEVILPDANRRDYEELPDYLRDGMTVHFAKHYRDVAKVVFG
ncbi:endopeptidase La [Halomonas elongata]|uniref:Lon protease n=1 Tax=Halomonas elongata (strain ATCC 33173 / DSM 2581 / NBRC 15536 / NCIMB 2198 / 1H9) TaxID=768066 RepID=E1V7N0_HALED|nr:endopeptidase La [Halomonas elongata]MBW5799453.1 endopeptidase La [Halomonas elongata]MDL4863532.1 endopeptidase La [Halomonas elongata]RAW06254.1 endopeptidase La [Halomonas elongata]WBF17214.1 endopeptidase La [Halomonas elongata]WPU46050.1 endopeptidase La [Halomonas elongata DSM 2581]